MSPGVILPSSDAYLGLNVLLLLSMYYTFVTVPFCIAFSYSYGAYAYDSSNNSSSNRGIAPLLSISNLLHLCIADCLLWTLGWAETYGSIFHIAFRDSEGRVRVAIRMSFYYLEHIVQPHPNDASNLATV